MTTLDALALDAAARAPGAPAVRGPDAALSYGELADASARMARALALLGVRAGDRVALWLPKGAVAVAATQGVLRLGAAYVPIDPLGPGARTRTIMADCEVAAAVVADASRPDPLLTAAVERVGGAPAAELPGIAVSELAELPAEAPPAPAPDPGRLAYVLYTSGSTGRPKGVAISHANALAFVEWVGDELGAHAGDRFSNHAPLHFDLSVLDLYAAFRAGAAVSVVPEGAAYSPAQLVELVERERITIWYSVPSALVLMIDRAGLLERELPELRAVLFAGEPFPIRYVRALRRRWPGLRLLNLYGPTETNVCTFHEVGSEVADERTEPVPIGRACSGDRVRALADDGREAAVGEEGELVVEGPTVMLGYWGHPPQRGAYRTGDVVRRISDDEYEYVGRRDQLVKVRGHRVELGEVEAALVAHPGVRSAAALVHGAGVDARLVAFVAAPDGERPSLVALKRHCAGLVPRYMIVDAVRYLDELPRTSTGKTDRVLLAKMLEEG